jgi:hypothetical protein
MTLALTLGACATIPSTGIEPRHDQSPARLDHDRRECESDARRVASDVGDAIGIMLLAKVVGLVGGAVTGAGAGLWLAASTAEGGERGLAIVAGGAVSGAAIGYVAGTVVGARAAMSAHAEQTASRFRACMRARGYDVIPQ